MEYSIGYLNENEFRKLERNLKKINMLAYKKLYFEYYPMFRNGEFKGNLISKKNNIKTYELKLPTEPLFYKVHDNIMLHYTVYEKERVVVLNKITPEEILNINPLDEIVTYKGVMVSKQHKEKDIFKINLLNLIQK